MNFYFSSGSSLLSFSSGFFSSTCLLLHQLGSENTTPKYEYATIVVIISIESGIKLSIIQIIAYQNTIHKYAIMK